MAEHPVTGRLDDDGGSCVIAIEAGDSAQSLWVRVGPIYDGATPRPEPGVWVEYQQRHMASPLLGPILLTPAAWRQLNRAVETRLRRTRCRRIRRWLTRLPAGK